MPAVCRPTWLDATGLGQSRFVCPPLLADDPPPGMASALSKQQEEQEYILQACGPYHDAHTDTPAEKQSATSPPGGGSCGERQHVGRREATAYGENILGSNGTGEGADEEIGAADAERHAGGREPGAAARPARAVPAAHHRGQRSGSHP